MRITNINLFDKLLWILHWKQKFIIKALTTKTKFLSQKMKVIFIALLSIFSVTYVTCQTGVTCQSLRRFTEEQCDQGGNSGSSGECACNSSRVDKLSESLQALQSIIEQNSEQLCRIGIKDGRVRDEDWTESSFWNPDYRARYARLDNTGETQAFWHSARGRNVADEWVQLELESPTHVTGVITQGRTTADQWSTSYKILYGNSDDDLEPIRDNEGEEMIFQGNTDRNSHVTNKFPQPITARYFRLVVVTFYDWPVLRIEYLTC